MENQEEVTVEATKNKLILKDSLGGYRVNLNELKNHTANRLRLLQAISNSSEDVIPTKVGKELTKIIHRIEEQIVMSQDAGRKASKRVKLLGIDLTNPSKVLKRIIDQQQTASEETARLKGVLSTMKYDTEQTVRSSDKNIKKIEDFGVRGKEMLFVLKDAIDMLQGVGEEFKSSRMYKEDLRDLSKEYGLLGEGLGVMDLSYHVHLRNKETSTGVLEAIDHGLTTVLPMINTVYNQARAAINNREMIEGLNKFHGLTRNVVASAVTQSEQAAELHQELANSSVFDYSDLSENLQTMRNLTEKMRVVTEEVELKRLQQTNTITQMLGLDSSEEVSTSPRLVDFRK